MRRSFSRVAIVNRGEAALRFIHAARELNREGERLRTIALFTDPDRHALFPSGGICLADGDETILLRFEDRTGSRPAASAKYSGHGRRCPGRMRREDQ